MGRVGKANIINDSFCKLVQKKVENVNIMFLTHDSVCVAFVSVTL